ncbi:MAG TPA: hypothetical protein VHS53_18410 [Mucilaginibacter sp.]|jgi:hypothetical protein|nr:hypothetical protein [Mucilaginibacter sp.]
MEKIADFLRNYPTNIKKYGWIIVVIILVYVVGATFINYERVRLLHFNGMVEDISYGQSGSNPEVQINGENYNLWSGFWSINYQKIEKEDKLIKIRGDLHLKMIKPNSKDTVDLYISK